MSLKSQLAALRKKGGILNSEKGTRYFYRALSGKARKRKKVRRRLEKQGRRNARRKR